MKLLSRLKENRLQYEFLPAAEEIVETPPSPFGRIVIWLITALLLIAFAWAYFGKLDIVAPATGKVIPEGSIKTIQPASAGTVKEIKVSEGQKVKQGQILLQLDNAIADSDLKIAEQSLTIARLEHDILAKTITGDDVTETVNAATIPDSIKQNLIALAESRTSANDSQRQLLLSGVTSAQQQVTSQQQSRQTAQTILQNLRTQEQELRNDLANANTLTEPGIRNQLVSVQERITSVEGSIATQSQQITQAQTGVSEANRKLNAFDADSTSTAYSSIVDQDKRIGELENAYKKAKQTVEQLAIKAPVDGTILSLATKTVGGVVNAAQSIAEIVPDGTTLIVDATVQNKDIGFIHVGQAVVVKVDTYSFQRYGYLKGIVAYISPDAINDEKQGLVYKMRVEVDDTKTSKNNVIKIEPGMSVTAEITTGSRRIIEFFLDPLMTHTDASLEVR